jgi:hypothetical protein
MRALLSHVRCWRKSVIEQSLALALDPVAFAAEAVPFTLDPWQVQLLRSSSRQIILNCARQIGKSTMTALLGLHQALFVPGSLVLLLAPSLRQSSEHHKKVKQAYLTLPFSPVAVSRETELQLEFANGSRILALPGKVQTIRGYSAQLLVVDEAAWVSDELYQGIRPMLAVSRGRIILLSTPFGKRGFFYREWSEGGASWERIRVDAYQCPRITTEFLEEERRRQGELHFRSEYLCEFTDTVDQVFRTEDVRGAISDSVQPLFF